MLCDYVPTLAGGEWRATSHVERTHTETGGLSVEGFCRGSEKCSAEFHRSVKKSVLEFRYSLPVVYS